MCEVHDMDIYWIMLKNWSLNLWLSCCHVLCCAVPISIFHLLVLFMEMRIVLFFFSIQILSIAYCR